ncbi:TetR family transcriptional regulator [Nonomuraea phyllanthi]|uniref:TetR family transcriptional regulator n=1 Tax=Nonomuraea phyllanthi TaxID=2219224 RepID=A0A5C4VIQ5_9ACTN|nr:TetR family transcriptional regulator [Nonomuraea phyllanthi]KAB8189140.1 TetR family transcriptional regulator [Nonomuraea phyllanthi]
MAFTERSAATRSAILSAARKLLAERGYEGTTIRAVAGMVGIDPSMVMRYYENKAGLFSAAIDLDLNLQEVEPPAPEKVGEVLIRHFLSRWEGNLADEAIMLLLRSATTNPVAAERIRAIFTSQIASFVVRVARCDDAQATHRAGLLSTQLLGLAFVRYVVELEPIVSMDVEKLVHDMAPVLQYYLAGDLTVR